MNRVERHIVLSNKNLEELCFLSKNLYNYANYILRQVYLQKFENLDENMQALVKSFDWKDKTLYTISEYDLVNHLTKTNQVDYRALTPQTSQQIIKLLYKNWKSFFKSIKVYWQNKESFTGKPKLPDYKDKNGKYVAIFTNQQLTLKDNYIHFPKKAKLEPLKTKVDNIQQVRVVPKGFTYIIEVVYKKEKINHENLDENLYLGIDLGVNNLATLATNAGTKPLLVNGRPLKSMNQFYNKKKAMLMSYIGDRGTSNRLKQLEFKRNNKITDYLHKTSRTIINYCIENNIKNIVIGLNKQWKTEVNISKANNQNFVQIPHSKLINQIEYKAEENGINVQIQEESHTSKCSFLDLEPIRHQTKYLGRRVHRGLFKSKSGKLLNADVNGSLNIIRKAIGDTAFSDQPIEGLVFNPLKLNIV